MQAGRVEIPDILDYQRETMSLKSAPKQSILARFAPEAGDGGFALRARILGMHCASCALAIEEALNSEPEVDARVSLGAGQLSLGWKGGVERGEALLEKVSALGYKVAPLGPEGPSQNREDRALRIALGVSGAASLALMLLSPHMWPEGLHRTLQWASAIIAIPTVLYAGMPFFLSAFKALRVFRTNMDVPISVALIMTMGMSLFEIFHHGAYVYFDSGTMLLFLLLIGRYLDFRTRRRVKNAAQDLLAMISGTATIREDGRLRAIPTRDLKAGMLLQVAAGEAIAADGVVESGSSEIDPSPLTGESLTQPVAAGTRVLGGMVNVLAPLAVRLKASSSESLLSDVIRLMERAEQGHARYVRLADKAARAYTPVVHLLAATTYILWNPILGRPWQDSLLAAMTVLIITCPCALGLAVPAVQVLASGRLFKRGLLLKSADALERLAKIDTVAFDKTGTLTQGRPLLANPSEIGSLNMQLAASLAAKSRHPLARALHDMYGGKIIDMAVDEMPGKGLKAQREGKNIRLGRRDWCGNAAAPPSDSPELWLCVEGSTPVRFAFTDELRRDAKRTVVELKQRGYQTLLLSGDRETAVKAVAAAVGIDAFVAQATPQDKTFKIEALRKEGHKILMVGDGLNDAPALATADVSMSPSAALDIAQNAADIVFQGSSLHAVVEALSLSQRAEKLVKENFFLSFAYNIIAVPIAMAGLVTPMVAAVAMALSSILVVLNAQRISKDR